MGGFYWLFNMVLTQAGVFGAIYLRESSSNIKDEGKYFTNEDYRMIALVLLVTWLVAIGTLVKFSEREFRHTFYSLMTARALKRAMFEDDQDDIKITIFESHRSYYAGYEDEVKAWLEDNWNKWFLNRPAWLTESVLGSIPLDLIPGGADEGVLGEAEDWTINRRTGETGRTGTQSFRSVQSFRSSFEVERATSSSFRAHSVNNLQ